MICLALDSISYGDFNKPFFLRSGEVPYFRIKPGNWADRLNKLKDSGAQAVGIYIPWALHEKKEKEFQFNDPYHFPRFLDLCARVELAVIARPGPYTYSEQIHNGLPAWLCQNYPEVRATRADGSTLRSYSISYLSPVFLEKARRWYDFILPILMERQQSKGGAIAAVQLDNELIGMHEWFGSLDYHPDAMGIGQTNGRYPRYLEARYQHISVLNARYGTTFADWTAVRPVSSVTAQDRGMMRSCKDYFDFYCGTAAEYLGTLASWAREHHIDVPLLHNSASPYMNAYFRETVQQLGNSFILGADHYYSLGLDWDQNNPTPKYAAKCFFSLEILRNWGFPATVFEMPSGSANDYPPITAPDEECTYLMHLAFGMKGCNYYIFAGGENPPRYAHTGASYDYQAPVAADGTLRPLFHVQKKVAHFLEENAWLARSELVHDVALGYSLDAARSERWTRGFSSKEYPPHRAWTLLRKGYLLSALGTGASPRVVDLDNPATFDCSVPLIVASGTSLASGIQQNLADFLSEGGNLLIGPVIPSLDENLEPCTILADAIGHAGTTAHENEISIIQILDLNNVAVDGTVFSAKWSDQSHVEILAVEELESTPVGYEIKSARGGRVILLGFTWFHNRHEHHQLIKRVLHRLGWKPVLTCSNSYLWAVLRRQGDRQFLFVMNLFSDSMEGEIRWMHNGVAHYIKQNFSPLSVSIFEGTQLVYAPWPRM